MCEIMCAQMSVGVYFVMLLLIGSNANGGGGVSAADYMETKADWLQTCQINSANFVECSTESIQKLFQKLVTGVEGLDEVETIDPMKLAKIKIFSGDGPVSINSTLSRTVVTGFANAHVSRSSVDPKDYSWNTQFSLPKMRIEGNYHMQGRILVVPLNGHGKCFFEPKDMEITMRTKVHLYENFGHVFYNVTETKVDYKISGMKLRLENLFDGVKALEDSTNDYLNDNWRPVSEALRPIITKTIEDILLGILNKIFHFIPAEYLISDIAKPADLYA